MLFIEHLFEIDRSSGGGAVVRRHDDTVLVHADDEPREFIWRGRRYTVCTVLSSWQERRSWWREVGDHPAAGTPGAQRRVGK